MTKKKYQKPEVVNVFEHVNSGVPGALWGAALMLYLPIFTDCFNNFENLDVHGWVNLPRADMFVTYFIVIGFFVIYLIPVINHNKTSDD